MVESFGCKETAKIFKRLPSKSISPDIYESAKAKLDMLHTAIDLLDLRSPPGNRLERLKGDRASEYSICINNQWRICFFWEPGMAKKVKIEDYH
jgi:proteic killer suppression protein